jgi:hypothetical protein
VSVSVAQEEETAVKEDAKRLPPYFKDVVSEDQKAKIYAVQATFDKQSAGLEEQYKKLSEELKTLRTQIDSIKDKERIAVEAVLTPQQVAKIKKLRAEAQSRLAQELLKAAEEAAARADNFGGVANALFCPSLIGRGTG